MRLILLLALALGLFWATAASAAELPVTNRTVEVEILALNDFHGNLLPTPFYALQADGGWRMQPAGGIEALASLVRQERARNPQLIFVGGGDLIGASPLNSALLRDEPTIAALNQLGLEFSALGNHELDRGRDELLRMQKGGCDSSDPQRACKYAPTYDGARFSWIAANVLDTATHQTFLPSYAVREVNGVRVAFIGAVLKSTPLIVDADGVAGLSFEDEATSINRVVYQLRKQGIRVFVALIHQGGDSRQHYDVQDCDTLTGEIVGIVKRLDPDVRTVISGHTHRGYQCRVDHRLVTQADDYGHLLTRITLTVDAVTGRELRQRSVNLLVDPARLPPDPSMHAIVTRAQSLTDPTAAHVVGKLAVTQLVRAGKMHPDTGEAPLGDLVADAFLSATRQWNTQIAFVNRSSMRADLPVTPAMTESITWGDAFASLPFNNKLVVMTLTGAQIKTALEQQWVLTASTAHVMQVSNGFAYAWDGAAPIKERIEAGSLVLNGHPLEPTQSYRVVMSDFLAEGGDGVAVFRDGTDRVVTPLTDLQALTTHIQRHTAASNPAGHPLAADRIVRRN
ncbi:bifunctional metallophosphatase/5'-nucleotidase [Silvimonas iriomotensis]|uniref:Multifunctional 2',3'-cyclic-nucleotide 2'-phosphodiesterase/5'-nucleotidase/3'-nucleotidase n=1 Tax=Silvimonas iriomotensis TaxID=449662 RepID=A0ABQ2PEJ8_9NEIS|nr:bifunctional metallophosphatase/5'-nucleotidase [Silvimonas iriomotensis]GGP23686.1 multifunctional 2',3'-cyclic-nucleotide 2'-phosphodiesterase/5'-nucleotidase/3'-nucleotidase [Silvimonas iriomotensis]